MALTLRSIVVPVDFAEPSAHAVSVAGELAARFGATLTLVHAETIEAPPYFTAEQTAALEAQRRQMRVQAERSLWGFGRRHTGAPFTAELSTLPPDEAILRATADADLIVMGTHGRRGPARWWLGSVAERVLRATTRPLLVVRANGAPPALLTERVEVHAFDTAGDAAAAWARDLAGTSGHVADERAAAATAPGAARGTTLVVMAVPGARPTQWFARHAEPWLRSCHLPIAFIPDSDHGRLQ